jgi:hypothetical protein
MDQQLKIRGFRIEPGEIEAILAEDPQVQACAVDAREDSEGQRRLIAWVTTTHGSDVDISRLRLHLRKSLPDYMIPQMFVRLEALPLTPNRKIDRKALTVPPQGEQKLNSIPSGSANLLGAEERAVRLVWEKLLGHGDFSDGDRFFDSGGDSLLALRLRDILTLQWGIDMPVSIIFQYPTIREQAQFMRYHGSSASQAASSAEERGRRRASSLSRRRLGGTPRSGGEQHG